MADQFVLNEPAQSQRWRLFPKYLCYSVVHHVALITIILAYFAYQYVITKIYDLESFVTISSASYFVSKVTVLFVVLFALIVLLFFLLRDRPDRPIAYCWLKLRREILIPQRLALALPVLLLLPPFYSTFTNLKSMIPLIQPFSWDPVFAELDRTLHFGRDPYAWLQPLLGYPPVTRFLYGFYFVWIMLLNGLVLWQTFSLSDLRLRMQCLITYCLSWILIGTLGATLLSSAGPCFYDLATGDFGSFGPLMEYLRGINETREFGLIKDQAWLRSVYEQGIAKGYAGISAMPSVHVAMAALLALVGRRMNRWLGLAFAIYTFLILLASVHLAYHYAVDGYVSIAAVIAIWWVVGWWLDRIRFKSD